MRIDRYVHDERLTWGAGGVLLIVTSVHVAGIGGLLVSRPEPVQGVLPPVFQVSLERLPPPKLPPALVPEPEPEVPDPRDASTSPPKKTRPVPILVDTPVTDPVPPDTQVRPYQPGDELLEGEPGPPSPPGAVVGGTGDVSPTREEPAHMAKVELVRMKPPVYPPRCLRLGLEGVVRVRVLVGENGVPQEVAIAATSGEALLDEAALEAVREWVFKPALRNGVPARSWAVVPIEFKLID